MNSRPRSSVSGFYSQVGQDAFIYSEFFSAFASGSIPRVIVDIGCNQPIKHSNSYFFESVLGFSCVAVDPLPTYAGEWARLRPNARFCQVALGESEGEVRLLVPQANWRGKAGEDTPDMFSTLVGNVGKFEAAEAGEQNVRMKPGRDLLRELGIGHVGVMSIDVEGFEWQVLQGLDFVRNPVDILMIENNSDSRLGSDAIRQYVERQGMHYYARFWHMDDVFVSPRVSNFLKSRKQ